MTVWKCELTGIRPFWSFSIPIPSSPRFSVYGRLPTQTSSTSHSNWNKRLYKENPAQMLQCTVSFLSGFLASSTLTRITPPDRSAPVTFVPSLNLMPCLVRIFWNACETSPSIPTPPIVDRYSTAVTSEPTLDQTEPY